MAGEIADDILDGFMCEDCGVVIDGKSPHHLRRCKDCEKDERERRRGK